MLDRNKHGVFNKEINNKLWNVFKIIFRGNVVNDSVVLIKLRDVSRW